MGGSTKTDTVTKQDNTPWGPAQAPLQSIYGAAGNAYDLTPKTGYSGSYIAPQSPTTLLAQQFGAQLANKNMGMGDATVANSNDLYSTLSEQLKGASATASKPIGDASAYSDFISKFAGSPGGRSAISAATDPILQNLQEKIIPQAKLNAVGSGVYGGDAGDINLGQAINDNYTRDATNTAGQLGYQAANDYFGRELQRLGIQPELAQAQTNLVSNTADNAQKGYMLNALPIDTLSQIGQAQDSYSQDTVKALYQQWLDQLNAPWQGLEQYRSAISGYPTSSSGTSTGTSSGGGF